MPETITTRCPSWARSKHRSLMPRVSGGFRSSGKRSPSIGVAILGYPTVQFKKADSFGFEPRRAAIGEKRPKNRGRMRALCQEMWILSFWLRLCRAASLPLCDFALTAFVGFKHSEHTCSTLLLLFTLYRSTEPVT